MDRKDILVSVDIGTSSVKVIIAEMVSDTVNILGVGNAPSKGIKKGSIIDIDETVHSIKLAIEQAERMIGMKINRVIVGVTGNHVMLQPCHGVVAVAGENREINNDDVHRVIDAAQVISIPPEREIIGIIPREFIVDGVDGISDPRGMIAVRLEMEGKIITGSKTILHNTLRCVERAGLEIIDIVLQPLAAGNFVLSKDEKNIGVVLIDIGGGSTTVAAYDQGELQSTFVIPVGGDNFTKDLSIGLKMSSEDAEKVKLKYGHAFFDDASDDKIEVPVIGGDQSQEVSQLDIANIFEARLAEIFELIIAEMKRQKLTSPASGYVLTGGVANMKGVLPLAQAIFNNQVRIATPNYIGVREPQYTASVSIIHYAYEKARFQGVRLGSGISAEANIGGPQKGKQIRPQQSSRNENKNTVSKRVKQFFGYFFGD